MMLSSLNSQQSLTTTDSSALVPIRALRNALIMNSERNDLKNQLGISRDSIHILSNTISLLDSAATVRDSIITVYQDNEDDYKTIVENKDKIIKEKDTEIAVLKVKSMFSQIGSGILLLVTIVALI